jgi:hypothetical protein
MEDLLSSLARSSDHGLPPMQEITRTAFISGFFSKERRRQLEMDDIGTAHPMHYHPCRFCLSHSEHFHPSRFSLLLTESGNLCLGQHVSRAVYVHGHNKNQWYLTRALNNIFVSPGPSFRPRMTVVAARVDFRFRVKSREFTVNNQERRHAPLNPDNGFFQINNNRFFNMVLASVHFLYWPTFRQETCLVTTLFDGIS